MKLWLSPYELTSKKGATRRGYLLKTQDEGQEPGYADIFPWPQFGDPDFAEIPFFIKQGKASALIRRSLYFSRRDALERTAKQSLIRDRVVKNHYLVSGTPNQWRGEIEAALSEDFTSVKIKVGGDLATEIPSLLALGDIQKEEPWIRLDFNGRGRQDDFIQLEPIKEKVQFVEDPSLDPYLWKNLDWPWAFDQVDLPPTLLQYFFRVIKPAKQEWELDEAHPLIFTSYLDHPVGIAHAVVEALESGRQLYDYGLMSQNYYEDTPFHEYLKTKGPMMTVAGDYGIGFDDLFDDLQWVEI